MKRDINYLVLCSSVGMQLVELTDIHLVDPNIYFPPGSQCFCEYQPSDQNLPTLNSDLIAMSGQQFLKQSMKNGVKEILVEVRAYHSLDCEKADWLSQNNWCDLSVFQYGFLSALGKEILDSSDGKTIELAIRMMHRRVRKWDKRRFISIWLPIGEKAVGTALIAHEYWRKLLAENRLDEAKEIEHLMKYHSFNRVRIFLEKRMS